MRGASGQPVVPALRALENYRDSLRRDLDGIGPNLLRRLHRPGDRLQIDERQHHRAEDHGEKDGAKHGICNRGADHVCIPASSGAQGRKWRALRWMTPLLAGSYVVARPIGRLFASRLSV